MFQIQPFSSKIAQNKLLLSNVINLPEVHTKKTTNAIFVNHKGVSPTSTFPESCLE